MTQAKAIKATATKATVQVAELQHNGTEVSYADIWNFVQKHAGGNLHNVQIVPLGQRPAGQRIARAVRLQRQARRGTRNHPELDAQRRGRGLLAGNRARQGKAARALQQKACLPARTAQRRVLA
jgi:hypothetical protein